MKRWYPSLACRRRRHCRFRTPRSAQQRAQYETLVATHAKANLVPAALVHRVIVRESRYQPDLVGRGGTIGLMQIKLATARGLGYHGDAEGLRDPDTNLAYGVKYLAGAYRAANGDHDRAVHYYAAGYYGVAKQQRLERERLKQAGPVLASAPPKEVVKPEEAAKPESSRAKLRSREQAAKLEEDGEAAASYRRRRRKSPSRNAMPKQAAAKPKAAHKSSPTPGQTFPARRPPSRPVQTAQSRVDTRPHRPTLALFRGELRRGAERPQAQILQRDARPR